MSHTITRKEGIQIAMKGFIILLIITVFEVGVALVGNGHIGGMHWPKMIMIPLMCLLSLYKAYYIVGVFMHLGHETRGMAASIVLPMLLLVWAIIAFLWEGDACRESRSYVRDRNRAKVETPAKTDEHKTGSLLKAPSELPSTIQTH